MLERERVITCLPGRPRSSAACAAAFAQERRQALEIRLALQHELVGFLVGQHVLGELRAEAREPLGDGGQPLLVLRPEPGARADEDGVVAVEDAGLFGAETQAVAPVVERSHAPEQGLVHEDAVAVLGQDGRHVALDRLEGVVGVRARQVEEDAADPLEAQPAPLHGLDGVGEAGLLPAARDGGDLGLLLRQGGVEGRPVMLRRDALEGRKAEGAGPGAEKGIGRGSRVGCGHGMALPLIGRESES
jgi:hypothetical protein